MKNDHSKKQPSRQMPDGDKRASPQNNQLKPLGSGTLARRILITITFLALVPLIIMAIQGLHCATNAVVELEYSHLQSVLIAKKTQLEAWIEERESDLRLSCFMSCGIPGCTGMASHMTPDHFDTFNGGLALFEMEKTIYESLAVYDVEWNLVGRKSSASHEETNDLVDPVLRQKILVATGIVASTSHAHDDGHIGLHMGYPLVGNDGKTKGYVIVNVNVEDTINGILNERLSLGDSGVLYLLSGSEYISQPDSKHDVIGMQATIPLGIIESQSNRIFKYANVNGDVVLGSSTRIPKFNWVLVAEVSEGEALGWLGKLVRNAITTGIVTFIIVLFFAIRFSRKLAEPLRVMSRTARQITQGAHHERMHSLVDSEAQEVGRAFNEMLDTLSHAQQKVVQSASLAAIGELSASIVHEMRNPLSSVKINLQALRKKVQDDANYAELADIAEKQAQRLENMLTELLRFGKPVELNIVNVSFPEVINDAIDILKKQASEKNIQIAIHDLLGKGLLCVDREQMRRALENLIKNAIQASPENGVVSIRARVDDDDKYAVIGVSDQGQGIPPDVLPRLFQPFVTTHADGNGLGLANVRKIVEMHEGTVEAVNISGGGALFTLRIPLIVEPR